MRHLKYHGLDGVAFPDIDCGWSDFVDEDPSSACSEPCGDGVNRRVREPNNPYRNGNGEACVGPAYEDVACNLGDCAEMTPGPERRALTSNTNSKGAPTLIMT